MTHSASRQEGLSVRLRLREPEDLSSKLTPVPTLASNFFTFGTGHGQ